MTTKDWLNRGWALDREITALESAKRRAYDRCVSGTSVITAAISCLMSISLSIWASTCAAKSA